MSEAARRPSLEQQRAAHAWRCVATVPPGELKAYSNLAKGLPALIMGSGLMSCLAYLQEKGRPEHRQLQAHLLAWLVKRFGGQFRDATFDEVMTALHGASPSTFRAITHEAMAWLRWMRQYAPARQASLPDPDAGGSA